MSNEGSYLSDYLARLADGEPPTASRAVSAVSAVSAVPPAARPAAQPRAGDGADVRPARRPHRTVAQDPAAANTAPAPARPAETPAPATATARSGSPGPQPGRRRADTGQSGLQ